MGLISESMRDTANHVNLIDYCAQQGIILKKSGTSYILEEHDSCCIDSNNPWQFYWHSRQIGGKAIDFVMTYENIMHGNSITFPEAVFMLLGETPDRKRSEMPTQILDRCIVNDYRRVVAYLCKQRGIAYDIVKRFIDEHKLYQDSMNNCVFPIYDDDACICGVGLRGTYSRFQRMSGEHRGHGVELTVGTPINGIIFFEAVIDLMSFYQLFRDRLQTCLLVALLGVKYNLIDDYHKRYPTAKIYIAFDNDKRGNEIFNCVLQKYTNAVRIPVKSVYKDWNDQLLGKQLSSNFSK